MKTIIELESQMTSTGKITRCSLALQIVVRLAELYTAHFGAATPDAFQLEHFRPMYEDQDTRATAIEAAMMSNQPTDRGITFLDLLRLSCAYCIEAIRAEDSTEPDNSWIYASYAQYWLGVAVGSRLVIGAAGAARSERGRAGAQARNQILEPVREHARTLALARPYKSKRNAALSIKKEVLAFAAKHGREISDLQAETTITGWLDGIPFGSKRGTSTG